MNENNGYTFDINGSRDHGYGGRPVPFDGTDPFEGYDEGFFGDEDSWYDDGPADEPRDYDPWSESSVMAEYERLTGGQTADEWQAFETIAIYGC